MTTFAGLLRYLTSPRFLMHLLFVILDAGSWLASREDIFFPLGLEPYVKACRALRRWRERREQAWLPIHVWAPVDNGGVSAYWALAGYKDAPGLRCMSQVPDMVQRWLLRDIKALGAQGAWDKHKPQMISTTQPRSAGTATFHDVKALLGFAPSDPSADQFATHVIGMDVTQAAAHIAAAMMLPCAGVLQQEWRNKRFNGGRLQYVTSAVVGSGAATTLTALGGALPGQMVQVSASQQMAQLAASQQSMMQQYAAYQQAAGTMPTRTPDPVRDPYLAANDLVERMRDHLGITQDAAASLSVKHFMLFVAIEAAKKDGEEYDDLDEALHEAAGVAYVSATERRAQHLQGVAGALYMAEWATEDLGARDTYLLYMTAGSPDTAVTVTGQMVVDLGAVDRMTALLKRAPSAVTYDCHFDFADDSLVLTDGKTRRRLDRRVMDDLGLTPTQTAWQAHHGALHSLWQAATPV